MSKIAIGIQSTVKPPVEPKSLGEWVQMLFTESNILVSGKYNKAKS